MNKNLKFKIENSSSGFTLIEILVSMALLSVLLVTITNVFFSAVEVQLRSQATSSRQEDAQYILSRLYYEMNRATAVTAPATAGQTESAVTMTINGQAWTYSLSNGNLILTNPAGTYQINSYLTTVTGFAVTRFGSGSSKAGFKLDLTVGSRIQGVAGNDTVNYDISYTLW